MSDRVLRYLQLQVTREQAGIVPGVVLMDFFEKIELISTVSTEGDTPVYILSLNYAPGTKIEDFAYPNVLNITEIISQTENHALVIAEASGIIVMLIHKNDQCWIQTPTTISNRNGLFMTIHGTPRGLKRIRDDLGNLLPDSIKIRISKDLKADWIAAPQLPTRRKEVMDLAVQMGYYDTPRKCTQRQLATQLGVRQGTIAEHLQSAERIIIQSWSEQSNH
tara:strand:- start:4237 stop:4899 length:663 start_codon:yes stop_codon:yes gene_type:complete